MKNAIVSVSLLALGAAGVQQAHADNMAAATDKPWSISGTLRGFYDDNYNTQSGTNRLHTFGFEIRPSASLTWSSGPTSVNGSYTYSAKDYTSRNPYKWDQSHDLEAFVNHNFSERCSLDLEESFVDSQEPTALSGNGTLLHANGDNYHNMAGFNFHSQITSLVGIVLGYANNWYEYTGNPVGVAAGQPSYANLLDRFEHAFIVNSRWTIDEETVGIFGYTLGIVKYDNGGSISGAGNPYLASSSRDNYSHDIYVGVEHRFRSDLSVSGRVGVQVLDYIHANGNNDSSVSPFAKLNVDYTYMDGGTLDLGFSHAKNQTDQASPVYTAGQLTSLTVDQESSTVSLTINQVLTPLSPDLSASLSGQYQNSSYNGGGLNNQTDDFYLLGLNLTYQFNQYISTEVGYNYDYLTSKVAGLGYGRNRVYIGVTASY